MTDRRRISIGGTEATPTTIACPTCGGDTRVSETRSTNQGVRRRRHCLSRECGGRLTTIEFPSPDLRRWAGKKVVLVPIEELDNLATLVASLRPAPEIDD